MSPTAAFLRLSAPRANARAIRHCPSEAEPACSLVRGAASLDCARCSFVQRSRRAKRAQKMLSSSPELPEAQIGRTGWMDDDGLVRRL